MLVGGVVEAAAGRLVGAAAGGLVGAIGAAGPEQAARTEGMPALTPATTNRRNVARFTIGSGMLGTRAGTVKTGRKRS